MTLPPPPGLDQPTDTTPPSPGTGATPAGAPAQPNPALNAGTQMVINLGRMLRDIAKAYPSAAPLAQEMIEKVPELGLKVMQHQAPGEPAAPPVA